MESLPERLMEELQPHTLFTIWGIPVTSTITNTWIVMFVLILLSIIFVRNFKTVPRGAQLIIEMIVGFVNNFVKGIIKHDWKEFAPFIGTIGLYLAVANTMGLFGFKPPTKDLNVTVALAIMVMIVVIGAGIRHKKLTGWLRHFKEPLPIMLPMNLLELLIRPLSLSMRLFGNILGGFVVMELLYQVNFLSIGLPAALSLYFDVFDGLIQMAVFVFLTTLYINEAIE